ncbi:unnamed protein product [Lepeophtheirus salmonis]|uniref:(salmon louse) hypothetical protein n=1 Tax=Lepeophtheirus salmonis TaxID=72036 RepID=A0A817FGA6_LEPSM|nr:unnamed protein product [Lepeophtheirus salmonis]CAG9478643.1 unnamed protein product [Lepeophtheirus salmonis]
MFRKLPHSQNPTSTNHKSKNTRRLAVPFIDSAKAINSVSHESLLKATARLGIPPLILKYLTNVYVTLIGNGRWSGVRHFLIDGIDDAFNKKGLFYNQSSEEIKKEEKDLCQSLGMLWSLYEL